MSTILVDNLTGKTSAGSITVTSEGGAATQSLQQGLAKAWASANQAALQDSLNVSSTTDNQSGDTTFTYSNAMVNDDYAIFGSAVGAGSDTAGITTTRQRTTTFMRMVVFDDVKNASGRFDTGYQSVGNIGDLA